MIEDARTMEGISKEELAFMAGITEGEYKAFLKSPNAITMTTFIRMVHELGYVIYMEPNPKDKEMVEKVSMQKKVAAILKQVKMARDEKPYNKIKFKTKKEKKSFIDE
jgi:plasmid maintenance system antidote protein VapI